MRLLLVNRTGMAGKTVDGLAFLVFQALPLLPRQETLYEDTSFFEKDIDPAVPVWIKI